MDQTWTPYLAGTLLGLLFYLWKTSHSTRPDLSANMATRQSVPSTTRQPGESAIYRHRTVPHGAPFPTHTEKFKHINTVYDSFMNGMKEGGRDKNCFGVRVGNGGPFVWECYGEVHDRVVNFGSGLLECGLVPKKQMFVGVYGKNCPEWVITELACSFYSLVLVPLYDTLGEDAIQFIINQTQVSTVVVAADKLNLLLLAAPKCPSLKYIVKIGSLTAEEKQKARQANITLLYFKGIEALGKDTPKAVVPPSSSDLLTVCYTSGTTGDPKGVMLTHGSFVAEGSAAFSTLPDHLQVTKDEVHLSFLPLAHIFEQLVVFSLLGLGASIAFYRGDVLKLLDDVAEARPTIFPAVPRLLNRIHDKIQQTVSESSALRRFLFNFALKQKLNLLNDGVLRNDTIWDTIVFNKVRARLGGRVRIIISGAAPIAADVLQFMRAAFGCQVLEGYGQTETCAACTLGTVGDYSMEANGHVGAVVPCCEIKLVDIPDMNYHATDKPNPRGEVCVRGLNVFSGYYKMPDKTAECLDSDGWCHTGDVGMFLPNGTLKIIDRKKNIFKLSQGEYIAPEKIENIYVKAGFVAQVFLWGESIRSQLVAIVVPDAEILGPWARQQGKSGDIAALCRDPEVTKAIHQQMVAVGKEFKLHSFEQAKAIYLEPNLFTPENGLLTPSFKSKRDSLRKKYSAQIEEMYGAIDG